MSLENFLKIIDKKTQKSKQLFEQAKGSLPGGVAGNAAFLPPRPIYLDRAMGGRLYDVDGNEYIDLLLGGFPNILGHSPKPVTDSVKDRLQQGTSFMLFNETGIKLAEKMQFHLPHLELIRFANSGTESTMFAIRVARAWTKKEKIAKPEGGYHGQHDYVLVSSTSGKTAGPDSKPLGEPDCAGIPKYIPESTIVFPWNDVDATLSIIEENAEELAAVILEPVQGFGIGAIPAEENYLQSIREITERHGILLIYDEIVTGFRLSGTAGAVGHYGVKPDLACYGKAIAGGFPIGAFGGRKDVMEATLGPDALADNKVFHSGTFTGNPISMAAGLACLTELENSNYAYIDGLAEKLRIGLQKIAESKGFPIQVTGVSSVFYPHFNSNPIRNLRDKLKDDADANRVFSMGMIANGVYMPPGHAGATCFAHTEGDIAGILHAAERVLAQME